MLAGQLYGNAWPITIEILITAMIFGSVYSHAIEINESCYMTWRFLGKAHYMRSWKRRIDNGMPASQEGQLRDTTFNFKHLFVFKTRGISNLITFLCLVPRLLQAGRGDGDSMNPIAMTISENRHML